MASYSVSTPLPFVVGTLHPSLPRRRPSTPPHDTLSLRSGRWPPSAAAPSPLGNIRTDAGHRRSTAHALGRLTRRGGGDDTVKVHELLPSRANMALYCFKFNKRQDANFYKYRAFLKISTTESNDA